MSAGTMENPYAGQGAVLLDIGGDVGAVVVAMPADLEGVEVEIRPVGAPTHGHVHHPHVGVVSRPVDGGTLPSLVYPEVVEGRYELWVIGADAPSMGVAVEGGRVTSADWPA